MAFIKQSTWDRYRGIINSVHDDFNQETVTWLKYNPTLDRYGESSDNSYTEIELKALVQYNIFRVWPMTDETIGGALDKENIVLYLNKDYLSEQGYLNTEGYLDFDPGKDIFTHMGQRYRASGETPISQAHSDPLFILIVLKRIVTNTGEDKY